MDKNKDTSLLLDELAGVIARVDGIALKDLIQRYERSFSVIEIMEKLMAPALIRIGEDWSDGKLSLSEVYMSGRLCEETIDTLFISEGFTRIEQPSIGVAVLDDFHTLGKKMVCTSLRASGFRLIDYGFGIGPEDLARRAANDGIEILLVSVLMLNSALHVRKLRDELDKAGASGIKLAVGGAPFLFDKGLWEEVGADAMGRYASEAIIIVDRLKNAFKRFH